jgi:cell division protein FtsI (penicillin-binding protein 3)
MSASPMHLAAAYATIANGGLSIPPTLVRRDTPPAATRVMSEATAKASVEMLRQVVTRGTASLGEVEGYEVAGKTGTADKPKKTGGYYKDKVINTFAAMFPASNPQYVLVVTLDEPVETTGPKPRRTAGWTAVPVAAEIIRRTAPLLGLRPQIETSDLNAVSAAKH